MFGTVIHSLLQLLAAFVLAALVVFVGMCIVGLVCIMWTAISNEVRKMRAESDVDTSDRGE